MSIVPEQFSYSVETTELARFSSKTAKNSENGNKQKNIVQKLGNISV